MQALVELRETAHAFRGHNCIKASLKKNALRCFAGFYDSMKLSNIEIGLQANAGKIKMEFPAGADRLIKKKSNVKSKRVTVAHSN